MICFLGVAVVILNCSVLSNNNVHCITFDPISRFENSYPIDDIAIQGFKSPVTRGDKYDCSDNNN